MASVFSQPERLSLGGGLMRSLVFHHTKLNEAHPWVHVGVRYVAGRGCWGRQGKFAVPVQVSPQGFGSRARRQLGVQPAVPFILGCEAGRWGERFVFKWAFWRSKVRDISCDKWCCVKVLDQVNPIKEINQTWMKKVNQLMTISLFYRCVQQPLYHLHTVCIHSNTDSVWLRGQQNESNCVKKNSKEF